MKRLFIIGNGFDRAHNLPTQYIDYRNYLKKSQENDRFCMQMENTYGIWEDDEYWWSDFETNLGEGSNFEIEFEAMANSAVDDMVTDEGEPMYDIEETLQYHFEPYYNFMNKLNDTVLAWVESIDITKIKPIFQKLKNKENYFFTFNYTSVLEDVYDIPWDRICHIHGSGQEGRVIMGHGNLNSIEKHRKEGEEKSKKLDKNGAEISNGIYKFYLASFKDTKSIIEWNEIEIGKYQGVEEVHVFGHSLGKVDMPYYQEIKKRISNKANWYFYIYNETEQNVRNKIEVLKIKDKYIHILPSKQFCAL